MRKIKTIENNNIENLLAQYPKKRKPLSEEYQKIYDQHYIDNRSGNTKATKVSSKLEEWMHKKVAEDTKYNNFITLEIGAGTLNHLDYETSDIYDIVEPFEILYKGSPNLNKVRNIYSDIKDISCEQVYDRIISIAVFEHIEDLDKVIEKSLMLLKPDGVLRVGIPNEGRFLWKFAYTITTGVEFKRKHNLEYSTLMEYEHINTADEIESLLLYYYPSVKRSLFGLGRDLSLYRFYECCKK